jgi:hypothetical protein
MKIKYSTFFAGVRKAEDQAKWLLEQAAIPALASVTQKKWGCQSIPSRNQITHLLQSFEILRQTFEAC